MHIAIIIGSARIETTTRPVAETCRNQAVARGWQTDLLDVTPFTNMFCGEYVTPDNCTDAQRQVLEAMSNADALLFVVPTYFKSMPGALKNFFDIARWPAAFDHKVIGFIASNHKNQDYGAGHADAVVRGMQTFYDIRSIFLHEIVIIHPQQINQEEVSRALDLFSDYDSMQTK